MIFAFRPMKKSMFKVPGSKFIFKSETLNIEP